MVELGQHGGRYDEVSVVVGYALEPRDLANGADRRSAELSDAFCDFIGDAKELILMVVEHEMEVAKVKPPHVPMKLLGLDEERKHVSQKSVW